MNQYNSVGISNKQPENNQNMKPPMPFNPINLGGLSNPAFSGSLSNLTPGNIANTFGPAGLPGEHLTYPYLQDMAYQDHMKKLREKFGEMREQIDKMEKNPEIFKTHQLPLARVKKIMKSDEDVRMISAEAPVLFAKACEIFIIELTHRAWFHTEEGKRRTLQKNDIAQCIANTDIFDFLIDIIPREEYAKNALIKKPTDSYMNFGQYPAASSILGNLQMPSNINYNLPSSIGVNPTPNLMNSSNMYPMANFKNPLVFPPNPKGGASNPLMNPNILNYPMMNPGQYGLPNFDITGPQVNTGSGTGSKGNAMSKKEVDEKSLQF